MWWSVCYQGVVKRVNHAAVAVGDFIYSFGGYSEQIQLEHRRKVDIDVYMLSTKTCGVPSDVPFQRYGHSVVAYGTNIYLWGGRNDICVCNDLFCFDTISETWSFVKTTGNIPHSRDGHSACIIKHKMYIFGGYEEQFQSYSSEVFYLNLKTMAWSYLVLEDGPTSRDFHTAVAVDNKMYVFGGRSSYNNYETYDNTIYYLDVDLERWYIPKINTCEFPKGRRSHSCFVYKDSLYIFGGYNELLNIHYNDLYKFCTIENKWTKLNPLGLTPVPRRRQACVVVKDRMYLFGGSSPLNPEEESLSTEIILNSSIGFTLRELDDVHILEMGIPTLKFLVMCGITNNEMLRNFIWNLRDKDFLPYSLRNDFFLEKLLPRYNPLRHR